MTLQRNHLIAACVMLSLARPAYAAKQGFDGVGVKYPSSETTVHVKYISTNIFWAPKLSETFLFLNENCRTSSLSAPLKSLIKMAAEGKLDPLNENQQTGKLRLLIEALSGEYKEPSDLALLMGKGPKATLRAVEEAIDAVSDKSEKILQWAKTGIDDSGHPIDPKQRFEYVEDSLWINDTFLDADEVKELLSQREKFRYNADHDIAESLAGTRWHGSQERNLKIGRRRVGNIVDALQKTASTQKPEKYWDLLMDTYEKIRREREDGKDIAQAADYILLATRGSEMEQGLRPGIWRLSGVDWPQNIAAYALATGLTDEHGHTQANQLQKRLDILPVARNIRSGGYPHGLLDVYRFAKIARFLKRTVKQAADSKDEYQINEALQALAGRMGIIQSIDDIDSFLAGIRIRGFEFFGKTMAVFGASMMALVAFHARDNFLLAYMSRNWITTCEVLLILAIAVILMYFGPAGVIRSIESNMKALREFQAKQKNHWRRSHSQ